MDVAELMLAIKSEYGMSQTVLAQHLGVSPQILTDIKAGRRRLSPAMAEKIMSLFAREPGTGWVAGALEGILLKTDASAEPLSARVFLPVLDALCKGDPLKSPCYTGKTVLLPEALALLTNGDPDAYVLVLDYDDHAGRLRAGDQVLILQNPMFHKEIMIVEHRGRLLLARAANSGAASRGEWTALATGWLLDDANCVGVAVGIVGAFL